MKLTIERATLLASLAHVQSVVERRNAIPILSNVLLEADAGVLKLTATDMDLSIVEATPGDIAQSGATTTPAHTFYDIVRKLPDGAQVELALGTGDGRLALKAGRSEFVLPCLPREDFPTMADDDLPVRFSVAAEALRRLIDKTRFAVSTEETRYYLNGIYLHAAESNGIAMLRAVATDGHRLAMVDTPLPEGAASMPGVIVPRKAINELRKLIDETADDIVVSLSETKIRFEFDDAVMSSKLIDGTFPEYQRVIPEGNDKIMEVDAKTFAQAVDRVSTISTEKSRSVKLGLSDGLATLAATSPDNGSATEELAVIYEADSMEIGFNSRYLLEMTAQIEGDMAQFVLSDAVSPTLVRDSSDEGVVYVLMPMRV